jgi:Mlc titration factor MtfA (ptsG expression regulator)
MVTVLQIFFTLLLIVLIILLVFQPRRKPAFEWPEHFSDLLNDYVPFYTHLNEDDKKLFEEKAHKFLMSVRITGANADVEDLDRVLIAAAAIIPVYYIRDWEYINLREVLLYPGNFNQDFNQHGGERTISGMVGTGHMQNVLILSKWELRQGFINSHSARNVAIHEFVHLIDKMDGTLDGVPELLLERRYVAQWKQLLEVTISRIQQGDSDIDLYAATSPVECFAVVAEYFFNQPEAFQSNHPDLAQMLTLMFIRK